MTGGSKRPEVGVLSSEELSLINSSPEWAAGGRGEDFICFHSSTPMKSSKISTQVLASKMPRAQNRTAKSSALLRTKQKTLLTLITLKTLITRITLITLMTCIFVINKNKKFRCDIYVFQYFIPCHGLLSILFLVD